MPKSFSLLEVFAFVRFDVVVMRLQRARARKPAFG